ncbi:CBS domain-containing protein [Breoghania sp. JC706]|uniref:CBS domain-containing protein n=1 Tax=Breoghania sp. JC706 TaxID=3117732 RepID=UPI00300B7437
MNTSARVATIMQTDWPEVSPDTPIRRAVALLVETRSAAAPVTDDSGQLVGILTQKDCFKPALYASYYQEWKGSVGEFMTRDVVSLAASDDLTSAAEAFLAHPHRIFPVEEDGRLVGMLRRSDVLAALLSMG